MIESPRIAAELKQGLTVSFSMTHHAQVIRTGWDGPVEVPTARVEVHSYYAGLRVVLIFKTGEHYTYRVSLRSTSTSSVGRISEHEHLLKDLHDYYDPLSVEIAHDALTSHAVILAHAYREAEAEARSKGSVSRPESEAVQLLRAMGEEWEEAWGSLP